MRVPRHPTCRRSRWASGPIKRTGGAPASGAGSGGSAAGARTNASTPLAFDCAANPPGLGDPTRRRGCSECRSDARRDPPSLSAARSMGCAQIAGRRPAAGTRCGGRGTRRAHGCHGRRRSQRRDDLPTGSPGIAVDLLGGRRTRYGEPAGTDRRCPSRPTRSSLCRARFPCVPAHGLARYAALSEPGEGLSYGTDTRTHEGRGRRSEEGMDRGDPQAVPRAHAHGAGASSWGLLAD